MTRASTTQSPSPPVRCLIPACFAAALALMVAGCRQKQADPQAVRILPLGDSITQGTARFPGYRPRLWVRLQADGARVDFVGSQSNYFMRRWRARGFDSDHDGHWGWTALRISRRIDVLAKISPADIVLLHLGSNDVFAERPLDQVVADLEHIVAALRQANPRVTVLMAEIVPCEDRAFRPYTLRLNGAIVDLASRLTTRDSRVITVDQFTGFDAARDTYDGVHPNERGAEKMAARWYTALKPVLATTSRAGAPAAQ